MGSLRILLLADSHIGLDMPLRPRAGRRRRGPDFLANHERALAPALRGEADVVVHGGDVFDRPDVPPSLAWQALEPLRRVADAGVPVFIVPGNHERGVIPHRRFAAHPNVHIFDCPRTFEVDVRGVRLGLSGFPFERRDVRTRFPALLAQTRWSRSAAAIRLLCVHHCIEGATVGPGSYTFTTASDVIRLRDIPAGLSAVLSGHIHRHQVLTRDLHGRRLSTPVLYPGSLERTSLAEIGEEKGFVLLDADATAESPRLRWEFREVPSRPMLVREVPADGLTTREVVAAVERWIADAPPDAVLRVRVTGNVSRMDPQLLTEARLRRNAPPTMNVEVHVDALRGPFMGRRRARRGDGGPEQGVQAGPSEAVHTRPTPLLLDL